MSDKILVICGPTATGKTALGFKLAEKFDGEIISSDSRQVYKYMDIGTGKEWNNSIKIWGYDLVDPKENFSVFEYFNQMKLVIFDIWKRRKLPIIVGGTGLYIKSLVDGIATVDIPKNFLLRSSLEKLTVSELFDKLATLDSLKAASMNLSDRKNPRRLIRAIEIAIWKIENETKSKIIEKRKIASGKNADLLMIGLFSDINILEEKIKRRIEQRINEGFIDEVENLLKMGVSWKNQSMKSFGYKDVEDFFKRGESYEDFCLKWQKNELKYAKKQMIWFKKDKRIKWFDVENPMFLKRVEKLVHKWYSTN